MGLSLAERPTGSISLSGPVSKWEARIKAGPVVVLGEISHIMKGR
jgi:hypothetical protein